MANALYPLWKEQILQGTASALLTGSGATGVYASLLTASYVYNAAHQFYNSWIASPDAVVGTDQEIAAPKTYTTGTFDGADVTYTAVSGAVVTAIGLYIKNTTSPDVSPGRLLAYLDTSVTGLPVTPNGGNINITWNASGIFTVSDARAKENIRRIGAYGIANIYEFNYRGSRQRQVGFIAQEIERFAPAAVKQIGKVKCVNYRLAMQLAA
jgi:Chaperone of endosialidase